MGRAGPFPGRSASAVIAGVAISGALTACDIRMGIACRSDSQCGPGAICIDGLCFASGPADAARDPSLSSGTCDAGENGACTSSVGEVCLRGGRACDAGTWGACTPIAASTDVESCGPSCGACGSRADRCEQGICKCGGADSCNPGQRCAGHACICDAMSCLGCCDGALCRDISFPRCGSLSGSCTSCDPMRADQCAASSGCQCGPGPQCAAGQRCNGGICVCDATSCSLGCCDGSTCRSSSMSSCGVEGRRCAICDAELSDRCRSDGTCACGSGPPCISGQRCLEGFCICDPCGPAG